MLKFRHFKLLVLDLNLQTEKVGKFIFIFFLEKHCYCQ